MSRDESTRPAAEGRFADLGRVHLLGIGGVGVSGVARILQEQGVAVSGSDAKDLPVMRELAAGGARITVGYAPENVGDDVACVIASSIAGPGNPEYDAAAARGLDAPVQAHPQAGALVRAAAMSVEQIRAREHAHGTVAISDFLETNPVWHTVNHPDNATLSVLAQRILDALGIAAHPQLPDYEMLGQLDAPVDPEAAAALGVEVPGRGQWRDRTTGPIDAAAIASAHLEHYRARPGLVEHGLVRHAERLANLGLMP